MSVVDVAALRKAVGARTDRDLATALGVERTSVAKWKTRGVPRKFSYLYADWPEITVRVDGRRLTEEDRQRSRSTAEVAVRQRLYGRVQHHYWVTAALSVIPPFVFGDAGIGDFETGTQREEVLTRLVSVAMDATPAVLGKPYCESEDECRLLVEALNSSHAAFVQRVLVLNLPKQEGPQ